MLGEKIGSETGKVTGQRVVANPGGGPKMETSFQASGKILGVSETSRAKLGRSVMRPDGTVYGEGNGIVMGQGGETATWIGQGVGTFKKGGAVSYRGAVVLSELVAQVGATEQRGGRLRVTKSTPRATPSRSSGSGSSSAYAARSTARYSIQKRVHVDDARRNERRGDRLAAPMRPHAVVRALVG